MGEAEILFAMWNGGSMNILDSVSTSLIVFAITYIIVRVWIEIKYVHSGGIVKEE